MYSVLSDNIALREAFMYASMFGSSTEPIWKCIDTA